MLDRDREVHSKRVRVQLDALEAKLEAAQLKVRAIERQVEELLVGQSAISVGSVIVWASANRMRRGRVLSVSTNYRGYVFRVVVLTKCGREIGNATVDEGNCPVLEGYE